MRINFDLSREILIDIADHDGSYDLCCDHLEYGGHNNKTINYHVHLLVNEGYIKTVDVSDKTGLDYYDLQLTLSGQFFLEKIENDSIWQKAKVLIARSSGIASIKAIELIVERVTK